MYVCMYVGMYVCIYICIYVCMYVCMAMYRYNCIVVYVWGDIFFSVESVASTKIRIAGCLFQNRDRVL